MMRRNQSGSALVELAISLPVLLLLFFGTTDFARAIYLAHELNNAARAGAQFGAQSLNASSDTVGIQNTVNGASPNVSPLSSVVSLPSCYCATDAAVLGSAVACTTTTCASGQHLSVFVTVTTTKTFNRITPFPGIPSSFLITRVARMRVVN